MQDGQARIRIKDQDSQVACLEVEGRTVIATGRWIKTAAVRASVRPGPDRSGPQRAIEALRGWNERPDIFTFSQKIGERAAELGAHTEWDDFAVVRITSYEDWLKNRIKRDAKENLRRAKREGVVVRTSLYDDEFVRGIKELYDETPIRQGKPFWHYGKSFEALKEIAWHLPRTGGIHRGLPGGGADRLHQDGLRGRFRQDDARHQQGKALPKAAHQCAHREGRGDAAPKRDSRT